MCGYHEDSGPADADDIVAQFDGALGRHRDEAVIKVYTSGSFLDPDEVPPAARDAVLRAAFDRAEHVLIESRPEHVPRIAEIDGPSLEVAIGLESTDDAVRATCVRKGFSLAEYEGAARMAREHGALVRTYLLLKPPFLTEREAIDDTVSSARRVARAGEVVSVNPVNVQRDTGLEDMWRDGAYSPPWLWSLVEVLGTEIDARLISSPSGGGKARGAHNCGKCDDGVLSAVREFSLDGDRKRLSLGCGCRELWQAQLELEPAAMAPGLDYRRSGGLGTIPRPLTG